MSASPAILLHLHRGERVVRTWEIGQVALTVGTDEACRVRVRGVSGLRPVHATFHVEGDEISVTAEDDADVRVNGELVDFGFLHGGDEVGVGPLVFRVERVGAAETQDEPTAQDDATAEELIAPPQLVEPEPVAAPEPEPEPAPEWWADDDDEDDFVEPFDLAEVLLNSARLRAKEARVSYCSGLAVQVQAGRVTSTVNIPPGRRRQLDGLDIHATGQALAVRVHDGWTGSRLAGQVRTPLGASTVVLRMGDALFVEGDGVLWRVDAVQPAKVSRELALASLPLFMLVFIFALAGHAGLALAMGIVAPKLGAPPEEVPDEVFTTVELARPEAPKPPPKPKTALAMSERAPTVTRANVQEASKRPVSTNVQSLLATLTQGSRSNGGPDLKSAISNINAVPSNGIGSSFDIAGAIGRLDGDGVSVARNAGGGAVQTTGGTANAGVGALGGATAGGVRGKVTKVSSSAKIEGQLSREAVSRVVNANFHHIQGCYERELVQTPGLAGRVTFEWTVLPDGSVKNVKVQTSTLPSPKVADCISAVIKKWTFPAPDGGQVVISYPFLFRAAD